MNRKELLELLIESEKENEQLREELREQSLRLESREIRINEAGNMANAALALNGVFENVDKAAEQYLENIRRYSVQQEDLYAVIVSAAEKKAREILEKAEQEKQQKIRSAEEYWQSLSTRLEAFYKEHEGLREYLSAQIGFRTDGQDKKE